MSIRSYLKPLKEGAALGGLGQNLLFLKKSGFLIPETYVLDNSAYTAFRKNGALPPTLRCELAATLSSEKNYAIIAIPVEAEQNYFDGSVRSRQVTGFPAIEQKIVEIWHSQLHEHPVAKKVDDHKSNNLLLMTLPQQWLSGFVFTRNPLNDVHESIVEVVCQNPLAEKIQCQQFIFHDGINLTTEIDTPVINSSLLENISVEASMIEQAFGKPVFLEWIYDGTKIIWVQLKSLERLQGLNIYSNKIARDMLPGIIKPLVWSVNTPLVSGSWKQLIHQLIGSNQLAFTTMTKQFYYRAYFNMGLFGDFFSLFGMPRETLEIMMIGNTHGGNKPKIKMNMKILKYIPRIGILALKAIATEKNMSRFIKTQKGQIDAYKKDVSSLTEAKTLKAIEEIIPLTALCSYNVIVLRLIRSIYHMVLRSWLSKKDLNTNIQVDTRDLSDVDPQTSLVLLKEKFDALSPLLKTTLENGEINPRTIREEGFGKEYSRFLERFGFMSDSTVDMSKPQWQEDPHVILNLIKNCKDTLKQSRMDNSEFPEEVPGLMLKRLYRKFVDLEKYSIRLGYLYSYGYSLLRSYFLHIGNLFTVKGSISEKDDIFYFTYEEIKRIIETGISPTTILETALKRKNEIAEFKDLILPEVVIGDIPPLLTRKSRITKRLTGLPASKGYYEGQATVVTSIEEFPKVAQGSILVIPYSDVSWTPLFSKVGAVVSESGGMLSHCSIIAREYRIPAVVGVKGALKITDNTRILVDGYKGEVLLLQ